MNYEDEEVEDFLDRHSDAIADVLAARAKETLKQELREALAKAVNRQVGVRGRWEAQADLERLRQLVVKLGIPAVTAVQMVGA
jgi:hypothetical protein